MCEISGLKPSNRTFRDLKKYENALYKESYEQESPELLNPLLQI